MRRSYTLLLTVLSPLALATSACASASTPTVSVPPIAAAPPAAQTPQEAGTETRPTPPGIHWVRTAAEQRLIYETTYAHAWQVIAPRAADVVGPWGVIIDADETLLDNSTYQLRRAQAGLGYTGESWNEWVREEAALALPGAVRFTQRVREAGGLVAVVTNRDDEVCEETRRNLTAVGIGFDVVLCRTPGPSDKAARFDAVRTGTTPVGLPPLEIVAWLGDNVGDFPGGTQALRAAPLDALDDFGVRYFVFPNPMYGSWEGNPDPGH